MAEGGPDFLAEFLFDIGVVGKDGEEPGEGHGGGFMASEDDADHFIDDVLAFEVGTVIEVGGDEHVEKVILGLAGGEAVVDDLADDLGALVDGVAGALVKGDGEPGRKGENGGGDIKAVLANLFKVLLEGIGLGEGGAEHGAADDAHGEGFHGVFEGEGLAEGPAVEELFGFSDDGRGEGGELLAMEGGLEEAAAPEPVVPGRGGEDGFELEEAAVAGDGGGTVVIAGFGLEDVAAVIGVGDEPELAGAEANVDDRGL